MVNSATGKAVHSPPSRRNPALKLGFAFLSASMVIGCSATHSPPALNESALKHAQSTLERAPRLGPPRPRRVVEQWAMLKGVGQRIVDMSQQVCKDAARRPCALELVLLRWDSANAFQAPTAKHLARCDPSYIPAELLPDQPGPEYEERRRSILKYLLALTSDSELIELLWPPNRSEGCILAVKPIRARQEPGAPAGTILVSTGLLQRVESDDELAAVLGHEFAHDLCDHHARNKDRARIVRVISGIARGVQPAIPGLNVLPVFSMLLPSPFDPRTAADYARRFGKSEELEADYIGAFLVARSRYNLRTAVHFWAKLLQEDRLKRVKTWEGQLPTHDKLRDDAFEGTRAPSTANYQHQGIDEPSTAVSLDTHPEPAERVAMWEQTTARLRLLPRASPSSCRR